MSLGSRIASMRGFHRYTQEQLGGLIGVTKQTVSGWETNRGFAACIVKQKAAPTHQDGLPR